MRQKNTDNWLNFEEYTKVSNLDSTFNTNRLLFNKIIKYFANMYRNTIR